MKLNKILFVVGIFFIGFGSGCSNHPDFEKNVLSIRLEDKTSTPKAMDWMGLLSNPTMLSDINCFAINVTGPGIIPNGALSKNDSNCTIVDNMHGRGVGYVTDMFARGQSIDLTVPSGNTLNFDVYGIYPSSSNCSSGSGSNSDGGYYVGTRSQKITEGGTLTIPISFVSGTTASVTCTSSSGGAYQNVALTSGGYSGCTSYLDPPNSPAPTGVVIGTAYSGGQITDISTDNSSSILTECSAGSSSQMIFAEFMFDASAYTLGNYSKFNVTWRGRAGNYSGACNSIASTAYPTGGGQVYVYRYDNGTSPTWETVGSATNPGSSTDYGSQQFNVPTNYVFSNKFIIRFRAPSTNISYCSAISLDYLKVELVP